MEKLSRTDDAYLEFFKNEHDLAKKEKLAQMELKKQDDVERQLFASLQIALRESQEKEKMRVERTKYWSIIGSVVGALAGMIGKDDFYIDFLFYLNFPGATISNRYRMQEFREITRESQQLYEDLIGKQEASISQLKESLSVQDTYGEVRLLNEQSEERLRSRMIFQTGVMIVSFSFLSLIGIYFLHR